MHTELRADWGKPVRICTARRKETQLSIIMIEDVFISKQPGGSPVPGGFKILDNPLSRCYNSEERLSEKCGGASHIARLPLNWSCAPGIKYNSEFLKSNYTLWSIKEIKFDKLQSHS